MLFGDRGLHRVVMQHPQSWKLYLALYKQGLQELNWSCERNRLFKGCIEIVAVCQLLTRHHT